MVRIRIRTDGVNMIIKYNFDVDITVRRIDGEPLSTDEAMRGERFVDVVEDAGIGELTAHTDRTLWIQGVVESRADNAEILYLTARMLALLEKQFERFEALYDVRIRWREIDEEYEDVSKMRTFKPFMTISTDMGG